MKCQILFSVKNKKNIINLPSVELAESKIVADNFFFFFFFFITFQRKK